MYSKDDLLTVVVLTYNQEQFIQQTIDSLLTQKTNFNYKILVCDDGSQDGTQRLLNLRYKEDNQVQLLLREENIGMMPNFMDALSRCNTKYIAFCDGDDYWLDPEKLGKQVHLLETEPNVDITSTRAMLKYPDSEVLSESEIFTESIYFTFSDLLKGNKVVASSTLMRNYKVVLPSWFKESVFGDWPFYLLSMRPDAKLHISKESSIVYRKDVGVTKNNISRRTHFLKGTNFIYKNLLKDPKFINFKQEIKEAIIYNDFHLLGVLNQTGEYLKAFQVFLNVIFKTKLSSIPMVIKRYLKTLIKK
ncbi:putative glycosyl transferase [Flavobacteria bacterium BBFL7]|nr:putative glycosyl transferase [Flavobacteria bacterium BBFL7]